MPSGKSAPSVYILDPDSAFRSKVVELCVTVTLRAVPFENPGAFLAEVDSETRGCVVMNSWLPGMTGFQLQEVLQQRQIHMPLIVVAARPDVRTAVETLKHGAFDFLDKNCSSQDLLERVFQAIDRDTARSAERARTEAVRRRLAQLTPREREVLELLILGKTTKDIAGDLGLSAKTVENHRARLMDKMEAANLAGLLRDVYLTGDASLLHLQEIDLPPGPWKRDPTTNRETA